MSQEHDKFIGEGDYENYRAKMHLKQFVHVNLSSLASYQLLARQAVRQIRLSEQSMERCSGILGITKSLQANYPFDGSLLVFYFEMTVLKMTDSG